MRSRPRGPAGVLCAYPARARPYARAASVEAGERFLSQLRPALVGLEGAVEAVGELRNGIAGRLRLLAAGLALAAMAQGPIRIVVVTHGQASDPFWSVIKNDVDEAAQEMGVTAEYLAPDTFDMVRMSQLIDAAVASRPDGLAVSIPDADALGDSYPSGEDRLARGMGAVMLVAATGLATIVRPVAGSRIEVK